MVLLKIVAAFALLAAVTALPASQSPSYPSPVTFFADEDIETFPWFKFPPFSSLFAPIWNLVPSFSRVAPAVFWEKDVFKVVVPAKYYEKTDLKVEVKGDILLLEGIHESGKDGHDSVTSQFLHSFSMPENATSAEMTAELTSDKYLIVTAPMNGPSNSTGERREIPIVETNKPYKVPETTKPLEIEEDKKEPTTPAADQEEITEKDNVIPHGNEAQ